MTDLTQLAAEIRSHAAISARPGQCASLEAIADRLDTAARHQKQDKARVVAADIRAAELLAHISKLEEVRKKIARDYRDLYVRCEQLVLERNEAQHALDQVTALAEKWENATDLGSGNPSIVASAFAAEVRAALDGA
jgi:hypothetical protein